MRDTTGRQGAGTRFVRRAYAVVVGTYLTVATTLMLPFVASWRDTSLSDLSTVVKVKQQGDSWGPMARALDVFRDRGSGTIYDTVFFEQGRKFLYPPSSLLLMWNTLYHPTLLALIGTGGLGVTALAVFGLASWSTDDAGLRAPKGGERRHRALLAVLAAGSVVTFYPILRAASLGNIQVLLNAGVAVALWSWARKRERIAGVAMGLVCLVKWQYGLVILWAVLRRRRNLAVSSLVTFGVGMLASLAVFGWRDHVRYLDAVRYFGRRGESIWENQSLNGFFNRVFGNGDPLDFSFRSYPPPNTAVFVLATGLGLVAVAAVLFGQPRAQRDGGVNDLAMTLIVATLASPIAWEHHWGVLLPVFAYLMPQLWARPVWGRRTRPAMVALWVVTSSYLAVFNTSKGLAGTLLSSYLLAGALVTLALLWRLPRVAVRKAEAPPPAAARVAAAAG